MCHVSNKMYIWIIRKKTVIFVFLLFVFYLTEILFFTIAISAEAECGTTFIIISFHSFSLE